MKAYKIELIAVDREGFGQEEIVSVVEDACENWGSLGVDVIKATEAEIGEWSDDHPLNTHGEYFDRYVAELFPK